MSAAADAGSIVSGNVITMDPARPRAEAFGVRAGRIVSVGSRAEVRAALGSTAAEFHAERGAIIPGLIDSHNHMLWTGIQRLQADVSGCASIAELLEALRRFAETHPEREWIVSGSGWHIERLAEKRYPTRQELDSVSSTRPIYLPRVGHAAAANSEALRRAGIGRDTPDPPGGRIGRDAHGEPDGLLLEPPAFELVGRLVPPMSREERQRALREVQRAYLAAGICGVIDPGLGPEDMAIYEDVHRAGELVVRSVVMPLAQTHDDPDRVIAALRAWGVRTGFGNERLKLGGIKVYLDGGASLGTALMREPWPDEKCQCGIQVTHTDLFHRVVETCASLGWSLGVHTVGGKAIDIALSVFEEVDRRHPIGDLRFSLIHAYLWPSKANIAAAKRLKIGVATQASMQYQFAPLLVRRFGRELVGKATPVRRWIDGGIVVGGGSDSPVTPFPPLLGMWHAVTRHVDALGGALGADEAVSAEEALTMYTRGSAWLSFSEHERGMIRPGLLADWVALSEDPLAIDPMALRAVRVDATAVGGEVVYRA